MRILYSCFLVVFCAIAINAWAATKVAVKVVYVPCTTVATDMDLVEVGKVKAVLKSGQIQLENGAVFVLDNIRVPVIYEHTAREFLETLVNGKTVGLYANKSLPQEGQADEHGNEIVHVVLEDGTWVQEAMVAKGLAWVDSGPNNRDCVRTLYKSEIVARAKKLGFWSAADFKVHDPNHLAGTVGTFILFEGIPKAFKAFPGWENFAFGQGLVQNGRTFTMLIKHEDEYMFNVLSSDPVRRPYLPQLMAHSRMRIRGWVESYPAAPGTGMIRVTNPEQIEFPDGTPFP